MTKEERYRKKLEGYEKAKAEMEKAQKAYQDEIDSHVLKPIHEIGMSRAQAIKLGKLIRNGKSFEYIMKMKLLPEELQEEVTE